MINIDITMAHTMGKEDLRSAAHDAIDRMQNPMGLRGSWDSDVYEFDKPARGRFIIADGVVRVEIELGEELRVAKSTIERRVHGELERLLKG